MRTLCIFLLSVFPAFAADTPIAVVKGTNVLGTAVVDTAAEGSFLALRLAKQQGIVLHPARQDVTLADGVTNMQVYGQVTVKVQLGAYHGKVTCAVVDTTTSFWGSLGKGRTQSTYSVPATLCG